MEVEIHPEILAPASGVGVNDVHAPLPDRMTALRILRQAAVVPWNLMFEAASSYPPSAKDLARFSLGFMGYALPFLLVVSQLCSLSSPDLRPADSRFSSVRDAYPAVVSDLAQKDRWTATGDTQSYLLRAGYEPMLVAVGLRGSSREDDSLHLSSFQEPVTILFGRDSGDLGAASTAALVVYICPATHKETACFRHR